MTVAVSPEPNGAATPYDDVKSKTLGAVTTPMTPAPVKIVVDEKDAAAKGAGGDDDDANVVGDDDDARKSPDHAVQTPEAEWAEQAVISRVKTPPNEAEALTPNTGNSPPRDRSSSRENFESSYGADVQVVEARVAPAETAAAAAAAAAVDAERARLERVHEEERIAEATPSEAAFTAAAVAPAPAPAPPPPPPPVDESAAGAATLPHQTAGQPQMDGGMDDRAKAACLSRFTATTDAGRVEELRGMSQRELQETFRIAFKRATTSNNNQWLRRRIAGAMGIGDTLGLNAIVSGGGGANALANATAAAAAAAARRARASRRRIKTR